MTIRSVRAIQIVADDLLMIDDAVNEEETFCIVLNDRPLARLVASRDQLEELGAGFVVCEGVAGRVGNVVVRGIEIHVEAEVIGTFKDEIGSSGGTSFCRRPNVVTSPLVIDPAMVPAITKEIVTDAWRETGGVHCSVLFADGRPIVKSSDIGRHNTVDKVVGYAVLHGIDRSQCVLGCTGRQPAGMVAKAANANIPIVVSKAASTIQGIAIAESCNITLICFARGERFTVYSHPERVRGLGGRTRG
jgi:FdhD protein